MKHATKQKWIIAQTNGSIDKTGKWSSYLPHTGRPLLARYLLCDLWKSVALGVVAFPHCVEQCTITTISVYCRRTQCTCFCFVAFLVFRTPTLFNPVCFGLPTWRKVKPLMLKSKCITAKCLAFKNGHMKETTEFLFSAPKTANTKFITSTARLLCT